MRALYSIALRVGGCVRGARASGQVEQFVGLIFQGQFSAYFIYSVSSFLVNEILYSFMPVTGKDCL